MKSALTFAIVSAIAAALGAGQSSPSSAGALLVLSKGDQTLSVVDPSTLKVLGKAPSGPDPHEVIASADGRMAYIANYNGGGNIITPVDLVEIKALPPIDLGPLRAPHGVTFVGGQAVVYGRSSESHRQLRSGSEEGGLDSWNRSEPHAHDSCVAGPVKNRDLERQLRNDDDHREGHERRPRTGRRSQTDWDETVVPVGRGAEGFDVSPDGQQIWAANAQDGTISIVDVASKKVTDTLAANVNGANRLKFTPDGKHVFVSSLGGAELAIIDAATKRDVKRLKTGRGAAGIQMQPDGARAYVACTPDDYVAVIDLKTLEIAGRIEAGRQPDGLAWVARR